MKNKYDVIVVGAGPSGGSCARELAKKGRSVLLMEKSLELGEPNFSTAGTPNETIKEFSIPFSVILSSWNYVYFSSKNEYVEYKLNKSCYTLDFRALKQFLAKDAIKNGASCLVGANAAKLLRNGSNVVGVECNTVFGRKKIYADVVVDATGAGGSLASQAGLRKKAIERYTPVIEFYMSNLNLKRNGKRIDLHFGEKYRGGYAWIFPAGHNEGRVGLGWLLDENRGKIMPGLLDFIKSNEQTKKGEFIEVHSHFMYPNSGIKNHVVPGFIAIGDAAAQVNPLAGEGIRHCMYSGRFAAEAADRAIKTKKQKELLMYNKLWKNYIGKKWTFSLYIQKILSKLNDREWDKLISCSRNITPEDIYNILFHYDYASIRKLNFGKLKNYF